MTHLLSEVEAATWVASRVSDSSVLSEHLPQNPEPEIVRIRIPDEATAIVALAYALLMTDVPEYAEERFQGALLWLQRWEIWSEATDHVGYMLLHGLRATTGETATIENAPAQIFQPAAFSLAHASLVVPMLFQWDAAYVTDNGVMVAAISHEGFIDIRVTEADAKRELVARISPWIHNE